MRRTLLLSALVLAALGPAEALADTVLVVVTADNGIYEDPVRTEAERLVADSGATVRPFGEVVVEAGVNPGEILRCVDKSPECIKAAMNAAESDRLLIYQLKSEADPANGPRVIMTGWAFDAKTGKRLRGAQRFCEGCTSLERLVKLATELSTELLAASDRPVKPDTWIEVHTTPTGATVVVNGTALGIEGQAYPVEAGPHRLEVRLDGHTLVTREIEVGAGETFSDRLTLVPLTGSGDDSQGGIEWVYKWAALGGGVAFTTLGIAWIAVDGPQSESGPGGIEVRKSEQRDTLVPGVLSTAVGVGLLGLSGYLFYRDMSQESATRAAVIPTRGGGLVGVSGRF